MDDQITTEIRQPSHLNALAFSTPQQVALAVEVATILKLVCPASWSADTQVTWIRAAVDGLEGIRADEVKAISQEVRRLVTRHQQIVPKISELIAERRARNSTTESARRRDAGERHLTEYEITTRASEMRKAARDQVDVEQAWRWERDQRITAGLPVSELVEPLKRSEIASLSPELIRLGLDTGALVRRDGEIVNGGASNGE